MAYIRTIIKGSLGAVETWSCSINWGIVGLAPDTPDQAEVEGILSRLIAGSTVAIIPIELRTLLSNGATIDGWRVEKRSENERILSVAEGLLTTPLPGAAAATKTPQDALVLSLRTATPGARGRGRLYWPALGASLGASFQMSSPTPALTAAATRTWLNAIGSQLNAYYISISSALRVSLSVRSVTDHVNRDVNTILVGSLLDTQRRRRDNIPETYAPVAYP